MQADIPTYFKSWSTEILSRANRVRQLIGDSHWLSDGMHKEFLIQEFLARHLPSNLHIDRGFVRRLDVDEVSREIDILVTNPWRHAPIFREGGLQIVPPSAVVATIEVKSTYRRAVFKDALLNVLAARKMFVDAAIHNQVWSSIIFATGENELTARDFMREIKAVLSHEDVLELLQAIPTQNGRAAAMPNVVGVLDNVLAMISFDEKSKSLAGC